MWNNSPLVTCRNMSSTQNEAERFTSRCRWVRVGLVRVYHIYRLVGWPTNKGNNVLSPSLAYIWLCQCVRIQELLPRMLNVVQVPYGCVGGIRIYSPVEDFSLLTHQGLTGQLNRGSMPLQQPMLTENWLQWSDGFSEMHGWMSFRW